MSIRLSELFERVRLLRGDLLPEQVSSALVEAARLLALDTNFLKDTVLFTIEQGEYLITPPMPVGREMGSAFRVERWDDDLVRWIRLTGPCLIRTAGDDIEYLDQRTPAEWGALNGVITLSGPADLAYAMRAKVSWIPSRVPIPEVLDFPPKAEAALIAWAKHLIFEIDGKGQDLSVAGSAKKVYNAELSGLCAIAQDGEGVSRSVNDWLPYER